jgi:hypothetical protein
VLVEITGIDVLLGSLGGGCRQRGLGSQTQASPRPLSKRNDDDNSGGRFLRWKIYG